MNRRVPKWWVGPCPCEEILSVPEWLSIGKKNMYIYIVIDYDVRFQLNLGTWHGVLAGRTLLFIRIHRMRLILDSSVVVHTLYGPHKTWVVFMPLPCFFFNVRSQLYSILLWCGNWPCFILCSLHHVIFVLKLILDTIVSWIYPKSREYFCCMFCL